MYSPMSLSRKEDTIIKMKNNNWKDIIRIIILIFMSILCGSAMLWLAVGQYSSLVYFGYIKNTIIYFLNVLPVILFILLIYTFVGKCWLAYLTGSIVWYIVCLCNYYKLIFRDDYLIFEDVLLLREATNMTGRYSLFIDKKIIIAGSIVFAGTVLLYLISEKNKSYPKRRIIIFLVVCVVSICLYPIYKDSTIYSRCNNFDNLTRNSSTQVYVSHGFIYPFIYSMFHGKETPPEGYNKEQTMNILEEFTDSVIPQDKQVNIIAVMREAYADFSQYNIDGLDCSGYDLYHELQKESFGGELYVNIFGGGTVNTERAFLTGNYVLRNFRGNTNSYVWYLKQQGYTVEGIHPYFQWFYNRRNVNQYLGFEHYRYFEDDFEYMMDDYYSPEDIDFYSEIYNDYKNKDVGKPYFSFNVNIQSHGPYQTTRLVGGGWDLKEYLLGEQYSIECKYAMNNYMNVIMDSDRQLLAFIEKLKAEEEPIVFVLFSDHLPWMGDGNAYYAEMGLDFSQNSDEIHRLQYTTEYLIWANDAAKQILGKDFVGRGPTISPCYLMNMTFSQCSWDGPAYMQAMSEIMEIMPVVSTNSDYIIDGNYCHEVPEEQMDIYNRFLYLQYYWRDNFIFDLYGMG